MGTLDAGFFTKITKDFIGLSGFSGRARGLWVGRQVQLGV